MDFSKHFVSQGFIFRFCLIVLEEHVYQKLSQKDIEKLKNLHCCLSYILSLILKDLYEKRFCRTF